MSTIHFIRPFWLYMLLPWLIFSWRLISQKPALNAWRMACDAHLLPHLTTTRQQSLRILSMVFLLLSLLLMIISLSGPSWSRLPVPIYQKIKPHVVLLDMSEDMLLKDVSPSRLERAKFILHDLFKAQDNGQFAMIAYTSEPFVVSPLTDDGETIDALLASLTANVMPVQGYRLDNALLMAQKIINQAGFDHGDILVLTAHPPGEDDIRVAQRLADHGFTTSVINMTQVPSSQYQALAVAGKGQNMAIPHISLALEHWLQATKDKEVLDKKHDIAIWKDEGRLFLIPALFCLLPVFRRGWLQRIHT